MARINIEILKFSLNESKSIFNTKFMLIVKLDYGFRLNLYLGFDIYVLDFDLARPNQKGTNQTLEGKIW